MCRNTFEMKHYVIILFGLLLPNLLVASSQDEQVKATIAGIYQLEKSFDRLNKKSEDEATVKNRFRKVITEITTGKLLSRWEEFISNTPIRSTFYRTVFESMTPIREYEIKSINTSGGRSTVEVTLHISELYAPSIDMITLEELYSKYKFSNMTIPEIISQLPTNSLAELVEYYITSKRKDTHRLKFVNGRWKIQDIQQEIISSSIAVKVPKKQNR